MPLRDHFHPPMSNKSSWEALHGGWPMVMVQHLNRVLPPDYTAAPRIHLGTLAEIDIATFEQYENAPSVDANNGGVATATSTWIASPAVSVETELPDQDEYEVRIYDVQRDQLLVAAIEIVSPGNKDRADKRNAFINKCAALLRSGVAVSIVDLVTQRHFNLYAELMQLLGHPDPTMTAQSPPIYAASCRWVRREPRALLEAWPHPLAIGEPLPKLPLWLSESLAMPLDLEQSYEQACRDLRIA
jgi:hypothetical protein